MNFKEKVFEIVKKIKPGQFLSYKEVAKRAKNEKAYRATSNILKKSPPDVPCHRVIRSDNLVGGYMGREDWDWLKAALLLKEGAIGVIPTDTIYGICTSAFNRKSVEKVYKLRKRNPKKPCIILISSFDDLEKFNVSLNSWQRKILEKLWPGKISVILSPRINANTTLINADNKNNKSNRYQCSSALNQRSSVEYLHRGTNSLSFRLPKDKLILNIIKISGPLIAPSANWEGYEPAKNIKEAKRYFGNKVFYLDRGNLISKPSTLIDLREKKIKILREGEEIKKVFEILKHLQSRDPQHHY
jgi:L-threonylcarbamoyladenylate synthase